MKVIRLETVLAVLTAVLVATGAGLWIWKPPPPTVEMASAAVSAASSSLAPQVVAVTADAGVIVSENIFSSTRAAPRVRYTPPGAGDEPESASASESPDAAMIVETPLPQVFGIMMGPGGATALIQSDSAGASGRLYREGDQVGPYRIVRITGGSVIVRGPLGRHELRIQPREEPAR
ncbi:MAG: hypothetical protein ABIR58_08935 [Gemmatimonadaceae bacterium]